MLLALVVLVTSCRFQGFDTDYIFGYAYMICGSAQATLLLMKRLFWKDIHHLLGLPVPSAYSFSTRRAASSCRT